MLTTDRHTDRFRDIGDIPEGKEGADSVAPSTLDKSTRAALTKIGAAMFRTGTNARQLFSEIDTNNDGTLSSHEFAAALAKLNLDFSKPDLRRILEAIDTNGSGKIDYMEFIAAFTVADFGGTAKRDPRAGRRSRRRSDAEEEKGAGLTVDTAAQGSYETPWEQRVVDHIVNTLYVRPCCCVGTQEY